MRQAWQLAWPIACSKVPAAQSTQSAAAGWARSPAGHGMQWAPVDPVCPVWSWYCPASQLRHAESPSPLAPAPGVPAAHERLCLPVLALVPTGGAGRAVLHR